MKKTKIICTIGPASDSVENLKKLMLSGMNICRLNFSHGSQEEHKVRIDNIKIAREELDIPIAIMLDTKGPEIRLGKFSVDEVELKTGDIYTFTIDEVLGNHEICSVSYKLLPNDVKVGGTILVDDGLVEMEVISKTDKEVKCLVKNNGIIKSNKGVNIPNEIIHLPSITEKDKSDILFAIDNDLDFIAASFVRKPEDVFEIRKILDEKNSDIKIISKIENQEGVENIDKIIEASDGIMVARGDLGVEIKTEFIPKIQKEIIRKCNLIGKPVITATQMLDSMEKSPLPTRAEVTDVYYAVELGADSTMLSGESASGLYPVEAVQTMAKIAQRAELEYYNELFYNEQLQAVAKDADSRLKIAYEIAKKLKDGKYKYAIVLSHTGQLLKELSKYRPNAFIIGIVHSDKLTNQYGITSGIFCEQHSETIRLKIKENDANAKVALEKFNIKKGDKFIVADSLNITEHTY